MTKVVSVSNIISTLGKSRQILFTHGTFDLFHIGHIEFLRESKRQGGLLIVGVDHDSNSALYKQKMPLMNQRERMDIVAGLGIVDYVLPFPMMREGQRREDFYFWLYALLRPHVITYGTNFHCPDILRKQCGELQIRDSELTHRFSGVITSSKIRHFIEEEISSQDSAS